MTPVGLTLVYIVCSTTHLFSFVFKHCSAWSLHVYIQHPSFIRPASQHLSEEMFSWKLLKELMLILGDMFYHTLMAYNYAHLKLLLLHSSSRRMSIARVKAFPTIKRWITIIPDLRTIYNLLRIVQKLGPRFSPFVPQELLSRRYPQQYSAENNDRNRWSVDSLYMVPEIPQAWSNIIILLTGFVEKTSPCP